MFWDFELFKWDTLYDKVCYENNRREMIVNSISFTTYWYHLKLSHSSLLILNFQIGKAFGILVSLLFLYARLKNGRIMPWQCPSVRLSVRPSGFSGLFFNMLWDINLKLGIYIHKFRFLWKYYFQNFRDCFCAFWIFRSFPGFFSTCFEISVWNLVYTCSRWCYTSSSSFISIGTLWPTLQPKIGQSHLSAFMALKII